MSGLRFSTRDGYYLFDRDREVLCGPIEEIAQFRDALNARPPADLPTLRRRVLELIQTANGAGPFIIGPALKKE